MRRAPTFCTGIPFNSTRVKNLRRGKSPHQAQPNRGRTTVKNPRVRCLTTVISNKHAPVASEKIFLTRKKNKKKHTECHYLCCTMKPAGSVQFALSTFCCHSATYSPLFNFWGGSHLAFHLALKPFGIARWGFEWPWSGWALGFWHKG